MIAEQTASLTIMAKAKAYFELLKARLSGLVVFSAAMMFLLANKGTLDIMKLSALMLGGFLVTGTSNIINQIIEKDLDKLMTRTQNRPLPTGRLSKEEAATFASIIGVVGVLVLVVWVNTLTAALTIISSILYAFVYTPLKRKTPFAVAVGAIPGALPPLIGWVAYSGEITIEPLVLFGIQFIWQFPHFWAIAWVADEDYKKAGFRLLPSGGGRDVNTAFQIMIYTLFLLPLGLLPAQFGMTGFTSAVIATVCGSLFLAQTFYLMKECSRQAALRIMFGSFLYLPIVQIAFVLDKL
ncbi:protoheme IX farnesyltransferase [Flexibacter flexilis DSM 6793]|uniref:Protoheme IX farnesyltransferase n=1 Tax=Flexibacter flexilis DSM 6793 TaxID=927664 RepID=A0A1I1KPX0_9BACT|nr:protoheme IX farnesyltransferase [Flexibacter flexilis DSM 6793]